VDLNGDGHRDVVSGSYPGEIFLFAGDEKGNFAKGEKLTDAEGKVMKVGRATVVWPVDWDADGDLDLLVGDIKGSVSFVPNESGNATMKWGKPAKLAVGEKKIAAPGRNSGPLVTDWDKDGKHDLVLGCGDGSVLFYRNTAEKGMPVLAEPTNLVGTSKSWYAKNAKKVSPCGNRAKIAVFDWNSDGRDDLLLGDFVSVSVPAPELTEEQTKRRDELQAELKATSEAMGKIYGEKGAGWDKAARAKLGLDPETPIRELYKTLTPEQRTEYSKLRRDLSMADPDYKKCQEKSAKISTELRKYLASRASHGYVWLFLREK
jgi:hypothetical protein